MQLSKQTRALLEKAGWSEGRAVNTAQLEDTLEKAGYPVFRCVKEFLGSFGGLSIRFPLGSNYVPDILDFEIRSIVNIVDDLWVKEASKQIGKSLCLLGYAHDMEVVLMMDNESNIYETGTVEGKVVFLGHSREEALENFLGTSRRWLEVIEID